MADKKIYEQIGGKMRCVNSSCRTDRPNFVITWQGMDWSGFRTLGECEEQFSELEKRSGDHFAVVER